MKELRDERVDENLDAASLPAMDRERLEEIAVQVPMLARRYRLTKYALLAIE